jgi:hypothetical protein
MSTRKRPVTRNQQKTLESVGPLEDAGELESFEQILERAADKGDAGEGAEAEAEEIATH